MQISRIKPAIQAYFSGYVTFQDRVIFALMLIVGLLGIVLIGLNHFHFHYTVPHWNFVRLLAFGQLFLVFIFWSLYVRKQSPRSSTFLWGLGLYFWTYLTVTTLTQGVQGTPFRPIDPYLVKADFWFHVNTPVLMAWTHTHAFIYKVFYQVYYSLIYELIIIPVIFICFNGRRALTIFFIAVLTTFIIGAMIYYFFPTMAPSGVFHSHYFSKQQSATSLAFFNVHHRITVTETDGGLIAFPSFHVIWAIILTYCCKSKKYFFYPLVIYNLILITATVFLGWHYLMDVFGAGIIALIGLYSAEKVFALQKKNQVISQSSVADAF